MELICFLLFFALMVIGASWFVRWADRRRVCRLVEQRGGSIIEIRQIWPLARTLLGGQSNTFWRVRYYSVDKSVRLAACSASLLRCRIYRDEAEDCAPRCPVCGYNLTGNVSGVCPECGAKLVGVQSRDPQTTVDPKRA